MSEQTQKVFITGATGDIGGQVLKLLEDSDIDLRIICRRQEQFDRFQKQGLDVVLGNLNDPFQKLAKHLEGCDSLLLITAAAPDQRQQCFTMIDAAISAGVKWVVKVSAGDARDQNSNVPWVKDHTLSDRYLQIEAEKHSVSWTLLSPSAFMENILASAPAIRKGFLLQTAGNGRAGWVSTADVAAVAAQVLKNGSKRHHAKNHIITGPALISLPEVADAFSRQIGHRVRYVDLPGPVFGLLLRAGGMDSWMANGLVAQFVEIVRPNKEGVEVSDVVQELVGRPPKSFEQFAADHKEEFQGTDVVPYLSTVLGIALTISVGVLIRKKT